MKRSHFRYQIQCMSVRRITQWKTAIASQFQSCPTNNHRKPTQLAQKNYHDWLLEVQRKVLWEVRLFITKGHFLKCLQMLVKGGLKRIRMKRINFQNTIYRNGEPQRIFMWGWRMHWNSGAARAATKTPRKGTQTEESHWNNVKQEVIFQVPQGRGLNIRNCCTFRSNF